VNFSPRGTKCTSCTRILVFLCVLFSCGKNNMQIVGAKLCLPWMFWSMVDRKAITLECLKRIFVSRRFRRSSQNANEAPCFCRFSQKLNFAKQNNLCELVKLILCERCGSLCSLRFLPNVRKRGKIRSEK
jgi:hypothetical protein